MFISNTAGDLVKGLKLSNREFSHRKWESWQAKKSILNTSGVSVCVRVHTHTHMLVFPVASSTVALGISKNKMKKTRRNNFKSGLEFNNWLDQFLVSHICWSYLLPLFFFFGRRNRRKSIRDNESVNWDPFSEALVSKSYTHTRRIWSFNMSNQPEFSTQRGRDIGKLPPSSCSVDPVEKHHNPAGWTRLTMSVALSQA